MTRNQERFNILKVDLDLKVPQKLLQKWINTRKWLLKRLGYTVTKVNYCETEKGYHFWFHVKEDLTPQEIAELQFLLGDDHNRARYNFWRLQINTFDKFNLLFNYKKRRNRESR